MTAVEDELQQTLAVWAAAAPSTVGLMPKVQAAARRRRHRRRAALVTPAAIAVVAVGLVLAQAHPNRDTTATVAGDGCDLQATVSESIPGFVSTINAPHPNYPNGMSSDQAKRAALSHAANAVDSSLVSAVKSRWDQAKTVIGSPGYASNIPPQRCVWTVTIQAPGKIGGPVDGTASPAFSVLFDVATGAELAGFGAPASH